jgi:hypothetical protein
MIVAKSPTSENSAVVTLTAAAAITAVAHGALPGQTITIASSSSFDILFGLSSVADPGDNNTFPAGVYDFPVKNDQQTYFRVNPHATGKLRWWISSME